MTRNDVQRRALTSLQIDYRMWMRCGDDQHRRDARNMVWVISGQHPYQVDVEFWARRRQA